MGHTVVSAIQAYQCPITQVERVREKYCNYVNFHRIIDEKTDMNSN